MEETETHDRVRAFAQGPGTDEQRRLLARTIAKVTEDCEKLEFNTAISALMVFVRDVEKDAPVTRSLVEAFVLLLGPLAAHLAEELWEKLGHAESLAYARWPEPEAEYLVTD